MTTTITIECDQCGQKIRHRDEPYFNLDRINVPGVGSLDLCSFTCLAKHVLEAKDRREK